MTPGEPSLADLARSVSTARLAGGPRLTVRAASRESERCGAVAHAQAGVERELQLNDPLVGRGLIDELRSSGLLEPGYLRPRIEAALWGLLLAGAYTVDLCLPASALSVCAAVVAGAAFYYLGIVGHDAGHQLAGRSARANRWIGHATMTLASGLSWGHWRQAHLGHHKHCQIQATDPDMQFGIVLATTPSAASARRSATARFMLRAQPYYFWWLALLYPWSLRVDSLRFAVRNLRSAPDLYLLGAHYVLWLVLPLYLVGAKALVFYAISACVVGLFILPLFALNHIGMPEATGSEPYLSHQIEFTRNLEPTLLSRVLLNGLQYHIEHHVLPGIPRSRLATASSIVRRFCAAHGLRYHRPTLFRGWFEIGAHLRSMAREARSDLDAA